MYCTCTVAEAKAVTTKPAPKPGQYHQPGLTRLRRAPGKTPGTGGQWARTQIKIRKKKRKGSGKKRKETTPTSTPAVLSSLEVCRCPRSHSALWNSSPFELFFFLFHLFPPARVLLTRAVRTDGDAGRHYILQTEGLSSVHCETVRVRTSSQIGCHVTFLVWLHSRPLLRLSPSPELSASSACPPICYSMLFVHPTCCFERVAIFACQCP
jgi:hypothetical protein